jgi:hypothetical protein
MCGGKAPDPVAPPAPTPVRDDVTAARAQTQAKARRGASSGYQSTMLSQGGTETAATMPVLGGS